MALTSLTLSTRLTPKTGSKPRDNSPKRFFINGTTLTLRKENDFAYQKVGNPSTWERYITFGYHAYDHCFQFETQWEGMKETEVDALTFIWNVYSYHLNRALDMPKKLESWAIDIARPYLLNNLPSALTSDTTDPRKARLVYEEPDFMDFDASTDGKPPAIEWQLVGAKNRPRPNTDATLTPLPASPEQQKPSSPTTTTTQINTTQHGYSPVATQKTTTAPDNNLCPDQRRHDQDHSQMETSKVRRSHRGHHSMELRSN
jgi:hypothetical protein